MNSRTVKANKPESGLSAGYFFKIGVFPFLLLLLVYFITLFIFNLSGQLEGMEVYGILSQWYIQLGVFSIIIITLLVALQQKQSASQRVFVINDPSRSWLDFLSVIVGVSSGIGALALAQAGLPFASSIKVPEPVLQIIISVTEEMMFRLALPAIIYIFLTRSRTNLPSAVAFIMAIIFANGLFAINHFASYQITIANAQAILDSGMPLSPAQIVYYEDIAASVLTDTLVSAFVFGMLQSGAFFLASRIGGGEWSILGVIGGHYIWNLLMVSIQRGYGATLFNPWHYIGLYLIVIFLLMFALGYFFPKRSSTARSQKHRKKSKDIKVKTRRSIK